LCLDSFITAGDGTETTAKALQVLDSHGADIIELVPYPDPLADGPVIKQQQPPATGNKIGAGAGDGGG